MSSAQKDTIYIDVDDEITAIIDKVQSAPSKIVALVLPKRATVLQSIVNMKLLKRTADDAKKKVVLITSEVGLLPLAGSVGLYVAKTLQTKPAVPVTSTSNSTDNETEEAGEIDDTPVDPTKPIGVLAGIAEPELDETIEVDNNQDGAVSDGADKAAAAKKTNKKLRVPNFSKFRLRFILAGAALILLIVLWFLANSVLPKADILIRTDTSTIDANFSVTAVVDAEELDVDKSIVPAVSEELRKTDTEKTATTGEKNEGKKAKGKMTLTNCIDDGQEHTVPEGTKFTSGKVSFVSTEAVTLDFAVFAGGECLSEGFGRSKDVSVQAVNAGTDHNVSSRTYNSPISGIEATGSDMSGGTDKITKVVSQADVNVAKAKLIERNKQDALEELQQKLRAKGYVPLIDTLSGGKPTVASTPNVGDESEEVTITSTVTFTMVGVHEEGLTRILEKSLEGKIDLSKQSISDTGFDNAKIKIADKQSGGRYKLEIETIVIAGAQIDPETIKQEVRGKKEGEAENMIKNRPGVKEVVVDYSPFWVAKAPKRTSKIQVTIESVNNNVDANNSE